MKHDLVYFTTDDGKTVSSCINRVSFQASSQRTNPAVCEIERINREEMVGMTFQNWHTGERAPFDLACAPQMSQGEYTAMVKKRGLWCNSEDLRNRRLSHSRLINYFRYNEEAYINAGYHGGEQEARAALASEL